MYKCYKGRLKFLKRLTNLCFAFNTYVRILRSFSSLGSFDNESDCDQPSHPYVSVSCQAHLYGQRQGVAKSLKEGVAELTYRNPIFEKKL